MFEDRSVCVTGAGGSIGSELCRRIVEGGAKSLRMISLTESGLYNIERSLRKLESRTELVPILGSVEDLWTAKRGIDGADIVIHAAAHKHVPICEQNPCTAIKNNVSGTATLLAATLGSSVKQFCLISTDKAVNPASIMGATKRLCELMVRYANALPGPRCFTVRFGNVLDSAGSVLPLWREQIESGGPVTLTDERCERYFMSIPEAVGLVLGVVEMAPEGGTFVLNMGKPKRLIDMATELIGDRKVPIKMTGLRPGEKLTEELHYGGALRKTKADRVSMVYESIKPIKEEDLVRLHALASRGDVGAVDLLWSLVK